MQAQKPYSGAAFLAAPNLAAPTRARLAPAPRLGRPIRWPAAPARQPAPPPPARLPLALLRPLPLQQLLAPPRGPAASGRERAWGVRLATAQGVGGFGGKRASARPKERQRGRHARPTAATSPPGPHHIVGRPDGACLALQWTRGALAGQLGAHQLQQLAGGAGGPEQEEDGGGDTCTSGRGTRNHSQPPGSSSHVHQLTAGFAPHQPPPHRWQRASWGAGANDPPWRSPVAAATCQGRKGSRHMGRGEHPASDVRAMCDCTGLLHIMLRFPQSQSLAEAVIWHVSAGQSKPNQKTAAATCAHLGAQAEGHHPQLGCKMQGRVKGEMVGREKLRLLPGQLDVPAGTPICTLGVRLAARRHASGGGSGGRPPPNLPQGQAEAGALQAIPICTSSGRQAGRRA